VIDSSADCKETLRRGDSSPKRSIVAFTAVAAGVRLVMVALGVRFDFFTASAYWQFLDLELLSQPWTSLNYLHAQPPLMNLVTAVALQFGISWVSRLLHLISIGFGIALCLVVFELIARWFQRPAIAWICGLLIAFNPAYVVYDHNFFYTSPMAFFLIASAWCLWRFFQTGRAIHYTGYAAALTLMALTRSMYHPIWLAANLAWPFLVRRPTRELVVIASASVVFSLTWPAKNLLVFGVFTSSSWSGMNMYNAVYNQQYDDLEMEALYAGRALPPRHPDGAESILAAVRPFNSPQVYLSALGNQKPDWLPAVPVLDNIERQSGNINFNHWIYLQASQVYAEDYRKVIRKQPMLLARTFVSSMGYYFRPATHNDVLQLTPVSANNLQVLAPLDTVYRRTLYGQWTSICFTLVLGTLVLFIGVPFSLHQKTGPLAIRVFLVFAWINVGYVFVVGNLFENYENMRFRFETEPLLLLGLVALAAVAAKTNRKGSKGE
jgi:4-amino-4-deoxy-L-arabinose transferase-like glycosyltransferase